MEGTNWINIISIAAGSGVIAAFINQGFQWLRESRKDAKKTAAEATLNAIALVGVLDRYVASCYSEVKKHDEAGHFLGGSNWCAVPELSLEGIKLECFHPDILAKLAWLKTERGFASHTAERALIKDNCPDDFNEDLMSICGYSGYELAQVARLLRTRYKLPPLLSGSVIEKKSQYLKAYWERAKDLILN